MLSTEKELNCFKYKPGDFFKLLNKNNDFYLYHIYKFIYIYIMLLYE